METPPTSPDLELARQQCSECAGATNLYDQACVSCQARHVARIPVLRLRRAAIEKRRTDLMAADMQRFTALVSAWFHNDKTDSQGRNHAKDSGTVPAADA